MKGSSRDRYNVGFSLDYRIQKLQVKNVVSFGYTKSNESPYGSFNDYTRMQPYESPYDDEGQLRQRMYYTMSGGSAVNNPLYEARLNNFDTSTYEEIINNLSFNYYLTDHFTARGQFSISKRTSSGERFYDPLSSKTSVYNSASENQNLLGDLSRKIHDNAMKYGCKVLSLR